MWTIRHWEESTLTGGIVELYITSQANTPGLTYTIEAWNFVTEQYEVFAEENQSFLDGATTRHRYNSFQNNGIEFFGPGVKIRVGWRSAGFTTVYPWEVDIDVIRWESF